MQNWIIGAFSYDDPPASKSMLARAPKRQLSAGEDEIVACRIKNYQTHVAGTARDLRLRIKGFWYTRFEDGTDRSGELNLSYSGDI